MYSPPVGAQVASSNSDNEILTTGVERSRYLVTLNALTATKSVEYYPITYVDQGRVYYISIVDTAAKPHDLTASYYRTVVWLSLAAEHQERAQDNACPKFPDASETMAIECVADGFSNGSIEVQHFTLNSFCIKWASNSKTGDLYCLIPVRFNLPKDSDSPEGISVMVSAGTEQILSGYGNLTHIEHYEAGFAMVKLFKAYGAQKKLNEDVFLIEQAIQELERNTQQLNLEIGERNSRSQDVPKTTSRKNQRAHPANTHKVSPVDFEADTIAKGQDLQDLHRKLLFTQKQLFSIQPARTFHCQQINPLLLNTQTKERKSRGFWSTQGPGTQNREKTSNLPVYSRHTGVSTLHQETETTLKWRPKANSDVPTQSTWHSRFPIVTQHEKSETPYSATQMGIYLGPDCHLKAIAEGQIVAEVLKTTSQPQQTQYIKPVACFYIRLESEPLARFRAIYLRERSLLALITAIAAKYVVDPRMVGEIIYLNSESLQVIVDDHICRRLPDGQDMIVRFKFSAIPTQHMEHFPADIPDLKPLAFASILPGFDRDRANYFDGICPLEESTAEQETWEDLLQWEPANLSKGASASTDLWTAYAGGDHCDAQEP